MNNGPGKWATRKVAYFGRLLLLASEITLQELLYYGGDFTEKKTCRCRAFLIPLLIRLM
jgi:hypothetical protein